MRERYCFQKTRECRQISHQPFILNFLSHIKRHVCFKCILPISARDYKRNHATNQSILQTKVIPHLRCKQWVAIPHNSSPGKQIDTASLQFSCTGSRKNILPPTSIPFNKTMNNRQQGTHSLNLIYYYSTGRLVAVHNLNKPFRISL